MGMSPQHDEVSQLLGAYALDSCTRSESAAIEAHGATCSTCAVEIARLRDAAGWLAVATGREPPHPLRDRVLDVARADRSPTAPSIVTYEIQRARMVELLDTLDDDDWKVPTADGRTAHVLIVHLAAIESLLASRLGLVDDPLSGEPDLDVRTAALLERHRDARPALALQVWRRYTGEVCRHARRHHDDLGRRVDWTGAAIPLDRVLVSRAFETWIHADDIRAGVARAMRPPPAAHMALVADLAVRSLPAAARITGIDLGARTVRVVLTGDGGGDWLLGARPGAPEGAPAVVLTADVLDFCLLAAGRLSPAQLAFTVEGDAGLASELIQAAPAFAAA
jgi:uncharacterized protein (TIGR03083 family)